MESLPCTLQELSELPGDALWSKLIMCAGQKALVEGYILEAVWDQECVPQDKFVMCGKKVVASLCNHGTVSKLFPHWWNNLKEIKK